MPLLPSYSDQHLRAKLVNGARELDTRASIQANLKGKVRVNADALTEFVAALFRHNNMPAEDALISARGIVLADLVGHESHGVSNNLAGFYLPEGFKDVAAYIVLLLVLLVRPEGLFGEATRKKV